MRIILLNYKSSGEIKREKEKQNESENGSFLDFKLSSEKYDDEPYPSIHPWYRGFKGVIEQVNNQKYVTKGIVEKKKGKQNVSVVTELPISLWTEKFKESVEDLVENKELKTYSNYSTDVDVLFELSEYKDGMSCNIENLKLISHISCNNMVLFSTKQTIKKYENVYEILDEFCTLRYTYYVKRKEYQKTDIETQLKIYKNKMRFLKEVMNNDLVIQDVDEDVLIKEMIKRGYYQNQNQIDENDEKNEKNSFGYLLNMNIRSFTKQKIESLQQEIDKLEKLYQDILRTTPSKMWLSDLSEFQKEYVRIYK